MSDARSRELAHIAVLVEQVRRAEREIDALVLRARARKVDRATLAELAEALGVGSPTAARHRIAAARRRLGGRGSVAGAREQREDLTDD